MRPSPNGCRNDLQRVGGNQLNDRMENLREFERVPVDAEIRFRYPNRFIGRIRDFSIGGMGATVPQKIAMDSPVEIEIFQGKLLATGHVRWFKIEEDVISIGIQFREGERELIAQIKDWKEILS